MAPMPLMLEQKDAIREYIHTEIQGRFTVCKAFVIATKTPVWRLSNTLSASDRLAYSDINDPTFGEGPPRKQLNLYDRAVILETEELCFQEEHTALLVRVTCNRTGTPEALILMYDVADRESFVGLEKSYEKTCDVVGLEYNYKKIYVPPARGIFKRAIDRLCNKPQPEGPAPYPILIVAVILDRSAPRQVTYDEGLVFSDRLGGIFYETGPTGFDTHCLEELVSRIILARIRIKSK